VNDGLGFLFMQIAQPIQNLNAVLLYHFKTSDLILLNVRTQRSVSDHFSNEDDFVLLLILPAIEEVNYIFVFQVLNKIQF
jgi:hypothetical protein